MMRRAPNLYSGYVNLTCISQAVNTFSGVVCLVHPMKLHNCMFWPHKKVQRSLRVEFSILMPH